MASLKLELFDLRSLPITGGEAQAPEAVVALDRLTYPSWGQGLSVEQYLQRERRLRAQPFCRAGLRRWVLRDGDQVLASCETLESQLSQLGAGGALRHGTAHGIASVFVEERLRGHGHASELLRRVHVELKQLGAGCAYLFSEVGPTLYEKLGYVARPLFLRRFAAVDPSREQPHNPAPWRFVQAGEVAALLAERYAHKNGGHSPLWLQASPAQLDWHLHRGAFYAEVLKRRPVHSVGARAGEAFALWTPDWKGDPRGLLRILMLYPGARLLQAGARLEPRSTEAADFRNVLHAARAAALEMGLAAVELWENPVSAAFLRGGAREVAGDVPMLLPLQTGVRAQDWIDYERCHWL